MKLIKFLLILNMSFVFNVNSNPFKLFALRTNLYRLNHRRFPIIIDLARIQRQYYFAMNYGVNANCLPELIRVKEKQENLIKFLDIEIKRTFKEINKLECEK